MASSYNRRISLFINGQQVTNDIRSIRAEMQRLVNEQARMTLGSQQYIAHARRIRDLRSILAEHNQQIAAVSRSWSLSRMGDAFNRYSAGDNEEKKKQIKKKYADANMISPVLTLKFIKNEAHHRWQTNRSSQRCQDQYPAIITGLKRSDHKK